MRYGKYLFSSVLLDDALLPPFKGSTFRGVFGHALKKVVCAQRRRTCGECLLKDRCVYTLVFETPDGGTPRGRPSPPHPFVIEPPKTRETLLKKGDAFEFALILFGFANDYLPYFIYAFETMGKSGIGRRTQGHRAGFRLERLSENGRILYRYEDQAIAAPEPLELGLEPAETALLDHPLEVTVSLVTPLRIKHRNRLSAQLPFPVLARAMLRRVHTLNAHFGNGSPDIDHAALIQQAEAVETLRSDIRWFDWKRYSNRQDQSMLMGGMIGEATYRGALAPYLPLLRFSEKAHLGKATTFGLGEIRVTERSLP